MSAFSAFHVAKITAFSSISRCKNGLFFPAVLGLSAREKAECHTWFREAHNLPWPPLPIRSNAVIQSARGHSLMVPITIHWRPRKRDAVTPSVTCSETLLCRRITVSRIATRQSTASNVIEVAANFARARWTFQTCSWRNTYVQSHAVNCDFNLERPSTTEHGSLSWLKVEDDRAIKTKYVTSDMTEQLKVSD